MVRRVAVIGGGCSGLACIKCCLEEGLVPVCFESGDGIGGVWRFKETAEAGRSSVYRSLFANTSKEMMCYSDFPMPAHYPNFMHHSQVLQYLGLYAEHFDLLKHIRFQTTVSSVRQKHDFAHSGQWEVLTESRDGRKETHMFDAVFVCSGHFTHPTKPAFPGIDTFPGKCYHSWDYKDPEPFCGKRVVVIGIGNSGGDIAVEISRVTKKTFLSMREGAWIVSRLANGGLPLDMMVLRRWSSWLIQLFPTAWLNWPLEKALNQKYNHGLYGLQPSHRILDQRPVINDDLPTRILQGALQVKPNILEFRGSTVVFDNGAIEEEIDAVVFCTGYKATFPFLPPSMHSPTEGEFTLFRRVFPLSLERHTIAILGLLNPTGPIMPLVEMQARWAARVFAGLNHLPPLPKMQKIIQKERKSRMKRYSFPKKVVLEEDYIPYMDSIAQEIGVRPNLLWLLLTDPRLGWEVLLGPCTPYQFRLCGPGQWVEARQTILTQWERMAQPFKTRPIPEPRSSRLRHSLSLAGGAVLLLIMFGLQRRNPNFFQNHITWITCIVSTNR